MGIFDGVFGDASARVERRVRAVRRAVGVSRRARGGRADGARAGVGVGEETGATRRARGRDGRARETRARKAERARGERVVVVVGRGVERG